MRVFTRLLVLLLLAAALSAQQIQLPPVRFAGPTGPNGPFPLFNSGTVTLNSDADYTLVYPDYSASVIRITTGTGVTLSQTRNIIGPTAAAPFFGFEFTIENATAGGQSLVVTRAAGSAGVTIPNGQAVMVIYDGTNYVQVGSPGGGPGGGGTVTSVGLTASSAFTVTGSPVTTSGNLNLQFTPQSSGFVLAGAQNVTTLTPTIVQSNICLVASGTTLTCTFNTPTTAGNLVAVGTPRYSTAVTDNLGQTYLSTGFGFVPTYYKESTAAGVTSVTITLSTNPGGAVVIWEISNIVPTNALDSNSYNVGNITGPNTPITWAAITSSAPNSIFLGYWTCPQNSVANPTAVAPYTLGNYQNLGGNSWSAGWVWTVNSAISTNTPVVGSANCPAQQMSGAVAFHAAVSPLSAPPLFRRLVFSDIPPTPWSALTNPTPNALTQLDMNTGLTLWSGNVNATGSINDYGSTLDVIDTSAAPLSNYRDLIFLEGAQSNVRPLDVFSNCASGTCAGFYVAGPTGNITMYPNSGIQIPGTGGIVSNATITSDTGMNAPVYNVCTAANPCTTPSAAIAPVFDAKTKRLKFSPQPTQSPTTRTTGGEPLSSVHLHDFSPTAATNNQVPIWNSTLNQYVPGPMTGGGSSALSSLTAATGTNTINNGNNSQVWNWQKTTAGYGLTLGEQLGSGASNSGILNLTTLASSNATPIRATVRATSNGFQVDPATGNLTTLGTAKFVGPVQLTGVNSAPSLATDASGNIIAGGTAPAVSLSSLTAATTTTTLLNGPNWQRWQFALTGANNSGFFLQESSASTGPGAALLNVQTISGSVATPFKATAQGVANGVRMDYTTGDFTTLGTAKFVGPLRLPSLLSAACLGTDASGNIQTCSGGGGSTSWSALTNPTANLSLDMGASTTTFHAQNPTDYTTSTLFEIDDTTHATSASLVLLSMNTTAPSTTYMNLVSSEKGQIKFDTTGITMISGVGVIPTFKGPVRLSGGINLTNAPLLVTDAQANIITAQKYVGPVQLPAAMASKPSLATDAAGNIIAGSGGGSGVVYQAHYSNVPMISSGGNLALTNPECATGICTMITVGDNDATYRLAGQIVQTTAGVACTSGQIQLQMGYTEADTGIVYVAQIPMRAINGGGFTFPMTMTTQANGIGQSFTTALFDVRAARNTIMTYRIAQTAASAGCTTIPQMSVHISLTGPLGY